MQKSPIKIEISHKTIIFTVIFLVFLWFVYVIRDIILEFFVALLVMTILNPLVTNLSKRKIPRPLSVLLVYVFALALISLAIAAVMPPLIDQTTSFINNLPKFIAKLGFSSLFGQQVIQQLVSQFGSLPSEIAKLTVSLFSNILWLITVLVFAFYLLSQRVKLDDNLGSFLGESRKKEVIRIADLVENKLGGWARGQLLLMTSVALATYIGLVVLGIPFALPLAILAGFLEIVPIIGPILAAVPTVLIGFGISPVLGFAAIALAFLVQQLENYILVPKIMQMSVGINPIITLFALAIGFRLAGLIGILISVPIYVLCRLLLQEYLASKG